MKKLIFYDLDGTLVDTRQDIAFSANHMLRQMKLPELEISEICDYVGRGVFHLISRCLKSTDPKKVEKGIEIYRKHYGEHMLDHSVLYPGVLPLLQHYKSAVQVVMTNKPDPYSSEILRALRVAEFFSDMIAGNSQYPKKPSPSGVAAMMRKFKIPAAEALFIGDSLIDIETARNAGISIAVLTHGFSNLKELELASPDVLAGDFKELLAFIQKKGW